MKKLLSSWLRIIRIRFLFASVVAVFVGLAINWWFSSQLDIFHALLTLAGVLALHASVDLLNDFWDFKRGIDTKTQRTKMSGGTGVLPEGLLKPAQVYRAGIAFLAVGSLIGIYFVVTSGFVIGILLAFAVVSIYFYSTRIVDSGLAELFVAIKGAMIVLGTYYIQSPEISVMSILGGMLVGVLSSLVLYVTSFPDYEADKSQGRKTLVIVLGKEKGTAMFWLFPIIVYSVLATGIFLEIFPIFCLFTLLTFPLVIKAGWRLKNHYKKIDELIPIMNNTLLYSRITGVLFGLGFILNL